MPLGAGTVLTAALDQRWDDFSAQFKITGGTFSEAAVHDLRVAARRLQAVLDIMRGLEPPPRVQKTRRFLKDQLDQLDELRDVQVMLVELSQRISEIPELGRFQPYLQKREKRLLRRVRARIRATRPSKHEGRIEKMRAKVQEQTMQDELALHMLQTTDRAYGRARRAYDQIDEHAQISVHKARIAFKRFRYMAELLRPLLPDLPENYFKRMHDYQSMMGDIRDTYIFLSTLIDSANEGSPAAELEPIRLYYEKRQTELTAVFLEHKGEIGAFWRAAPDQAFPWENRNDPIHRPPRNRRSSNSGRQRRRQPAPTDLRGKEEDATHRAGPEGIGRADRPDSDQPIPAGDSDRADPRQ